MNIIKLVDNHRWLTAQIEELKYIQTEKTRIWSIPYSLQYWKNFLHLNKIEGLGIEVGCGNHGLYNFTESVIGLDSINFKNRNFVRGVAESLPFKQVDFIISCNGLDHYKDARECLNEMFRISSRIILWVYVFPKLVSWLLQKIDLMHPYHLTKTNLKKLLSDFNFTETKKVICSPLNHLQYTKNFKMRMKLFIAHILGVRGLCLHLEVCR